MEELYKAIEEKIREAGYKGEVDGFSIYEEISDEIEGKENGSYLFLSKKANGAVYEYRVDVMEEEFNLSYLDIHEGEEVCHVDFDH